ncbi:MAG: DUF45 domain-containing protein [Opitutales bacterium]|nr:DUF45 domain-containing protein [Opitutales bacterium]
MIAQNNIELSLGGSPQIFALEISRGRGRRNMTMRLKYPCIISVSAPWGVSKAEILNFVRGNAKWVFEALKNLKKPVGLLEYLRENPQIFVGGKKLNVSFFNSRSVSGFWVENIEKGEIVFAFSEEDAASFKNLFLRYAKEAVLKSVTCVATEKNLGVPKISVRDQRSRWASRSSSGTMSFNWRILLLDSRLQKYIILHEFAHEKFMDHSVSFWIYLNRLIEGARRLDRLVSREGEKIFAIER